MYCKQLYQSAKQVKTHRTLHGSYTAQNRSTLNLPDTSDTATKLCMYANTYLGTDAAFRRELPLLTGAVPVPLLDADRKAFRSHLAGSCLSDKTGCQLLIGEAKYQLRGRLAIDESVL